MPEEQYNPNHAHVIASHNALIISLSEEHQKQAKACLHRSGSVTFKIEEINVRDIPHVGAIGAVIVD